MASGSEDHGAKPPPAPSTVPGPNDGPPSYRRTLANRPFLLLWASQLVSQSGDFIFEVALLWLVLELTHSAFSLAIVVTGTILPGVILGPFLGVYVDRWDRRRTLIATNVVEGIIIAALSGLVLAGHATLPGLFVIVLMLGSGSTIVRIATTAYVPSIVPGRTSRRPTASSRSAIRRTRSSACRSEACSSRSSAWRCRSSTTRSRSSPRQPC
jgi:MFS family permease